MMEIAQIKDHVHRVVADGAHGVHGGERLQVPRGPSSTLNHCGRPHSAALQDVSKPLETWSPLHSSDHPSGSP